MIELTKDDEVIIRMWNDGNAASDIAAVLNRTRNSVIGRIYRLRTVGIMLRQCDQKQRAVKPKNPDWKKVQIKAKQEKPKNPDWKKVQIKAKQDRLKVRKRKVPEPPVGCLTILELNRNNCRYIIGEPHGVHTIYCSAKVYSRSYCKKHHDLCYYNSPPRLKRKQPSYVAGEANSWSD